MYQTGSAENLTELMGKFGEFAHLCGWVIDNHNTATLPALFLHNNSGYWSFGLGASKTTYYVLGNTGFSPSRAYNEQPGSSMINHISAQIYYGAGVSEITGTFLTYDFFGTADYIHAVIQVADGKFRHFGIGTLNKEFDFTGGQYAYGTTVSNDSTSMIGNYFSLPFADFISTYWSRASYTSAVRVDTADASPGWRLFRDDLAGLSAVGLGAGFSESNSAKHPDALQVVCSFSQFGNVISPVNNAIFIKDDAGIWRRTGTVPDFFVCRARGILPRIRMKINDADFMLIPVVQFQATTDAAPAGQNNSYDYFYAYRVNE